MFTVEISKHQFLLENTVLLFDGVVVTWSPCSPDCPRTCYVEQAGINSRDFPASASPILGLRVCTTDVFTRYTIRFGIG